MNCMDFEKRFHRFTGYVQGKYQILDFLETLGEKVKESHKECGFD